jgi:predicted ester cyclase
MPADDRLRELTRRWISLWSTPVDWALFDALHSPAFEDGAAAGREPGKQGFAAGLRQFTEAFPDLVTVVDDMVVDAAANKVAVRWTAVGSNRAHFLGVGPTLRRTRITGIEIVEFSGDLIVRRWGEWDISDHRPLP